MGPSHDYQWLASALSISPFRSHSAQRWRTAVLLVLAIVMITLLLPTSHHTVSSGANPFVFSSPGQPIRDSEPTVAVADMEWVTALMTAASASCGWGATPHRETTKSAYGPPQPMPEEYPYWLTNSDQFALDDILTTRFQTYSKRVAVFSHSAPDFIYLPVLSQIWSNPWGCEHAELHYGIQRTTRFLRDMVAKVGPSPYPRIILPIAPVRSQLERNVLTPEIMDEIRDSVILVSIENAPKTHQERMKYLIDVPYPTAFHLSLSSNGSRPTLDDSFLKANRPYLLHYAACASHPWGMPATETFNGFALRAALYNQLTEYLSSLPPERPSRIIYDNISNPVDGAQNLTLFHEHMASAVFCPMPPGDSPSRRAFYEAILLGCIPVIFRRTAYGRLFPSAPEINDMSQYTVFVDENEMITRRGEPLVERLEAIPPATVQKLQRHIRHIAHKLQWAIPDKEEWFAQSSSASGRDPPPEDAPIFNHTRAVEQERRNPPTEDAFAMLLNELAMIRDGAWVPGKAVDVRQDPSDSYRY
ncbi:hypothetical protein JCM1840_007489 [Sporobolomyces johnsonii]